MTRRDAVYAFAVFAELIAAAREAGTQAPAAPPRAPIRFDLPNLSMDDWEVTISHVDYPPGRVGSAHRHAGFVLAYVTLPLVSVVTCAGVSADMAEPMAR